jgi:integrase
VASLELRKNNFRVVFTHAGRKRGYSLDTGDRFAAEQLVKSVETLLWEVERGYKAVPDGVDIVAFLKSGGQAPKPTPVAAPEPVTFADLRDGYLAAHSAGAMEANSLETVRMHLRHFAATLGERFAAQSLSLDDLQRHVNRRAAKHYRGKPLSTVTLRKEAATLRAVWNWGVAAGKLRGPFPNRGLKFPKTDEKPPFMTWGEIERRLSGLSEDEREQLWDHLFLTRPEIDELLAHVKGAAVHGWIYPAVCFAAHTGARRSEVIRARLQDLDLEGMAVVIREKKRARGMRTTRRVPLSPFLAGVLREWQTVHAGGPFLFCHAGVVARSRKRNLTTGHRGEKTRATTQKGRTVAVRRRENSATAGLTKDEAHDHFRRTMADSKWAVLRGWHVLRHSFVSNCAARGVDQRLIDGWVGHTTEEMRKRYRHLIPNIEQQAIRTVFS